MSFSVKQYLSQFLNKNSGKYTTTQQAQHFDKIEKYLQSNKIDALFNQMIVDIVFKRPDDIKTGLLTVLKKLKACDKFFKKSDFEDMFQNYNFFQDRNQNLVNISNLEQCLANLNIEVTLEKLKQKYPQIQNKTYLNKKEFVQIVEKQYNQRTSF